MGEAQQGEWSAAAQAKKQRELEAETKRQAEELKRFHSQQTAQAQVGPNTYVPLQSTFEQQAGVNPENFTGVTDIKTGELLDRYKSDPYAGVAAQELKKQAFAEGASPWAQMQLQKQQLEQSKMQDQTTLQNQQAQSMAQSGLMRMGGMNSGARALLARGGARDQMFANQDVARQGVEQRLGINQQDQDRKSQLLKGFSDAEVQGQQFNIGNMTNDLKNRSTFDANRYNQQMEAWAAKQSADAQRASSGGGKK